MDKVEGVDYTPAGIRALRDQCIGMRDEAMKQWASDPRAIDFTVIMTHVVAHLHTYADMIEKAEGVTRATSADGTHTAEWTRSDAGGAVKIKATWKDDPRANEDDQEHHYPSG